MVVHRPAHGAANVGLQNFRQSEKSLKIRTDTRWEIRFDSAFEQVMRACAAPRKDGNGTWISEDIVAGYCGLHQLGYAFIRSLARR
jgi:Leu/Phe-tRNA-protein transferase